MKLRFHEYAIRSWRKEDAASIVKYANNRKIWKNLRDGFPSPYTLNDADQFLSKAMTANPETLYAIVTPLEAIGGIGIGLKQDVHRFTAELGYWLAEPYWNKAIMTRAVQFFVDFAFETYDLVRIHAEPFEYNHASFRVLEKAGFKFEGRLKASTFKDSLIVDQIVYAKINENHQKILNSS